MWMEHLRHLGHCSCGQSAGGCAGAPHVTLFDMLTSDPSLLPPSTTTTPAPTSALPHHAATSCHLIHLAPCQRSWPTPTNLICERPSQEHDDSWALNRRKTRDTRDKRVLDPVVSTTPPLLSITIWKHPPGHLPKPESSPFEHTCVHVTTNDAELTTSGLQTPAAIAFTLSADPCHLRVKHRPTSPSR